MLRKIAVFSALTTLMACGGSGGDDGVDADDPVVRADAGGDSAQASDDAGSDAAVNSGMDSATSADAGSDAASNSDADTSDAALDSGASMDGGDTGTADTGTADTGAPDASADGGTDAGPDATVTPPAITVVVRRGAAQPLAQAPVFLHDANGALIAELTTGADGRVESATAAAMVTIVVPRSGDITAPIVEPRLYTFAEVATGDALVLELPPAENAQPGYTVSLQADTALPAAPAFQGVKVFGGGASYECREVVASALSFSPPVALGWRSSCPVQPTNTLLAIAYSTSNWPIAHAWSTSVAPFGNAAAAATVAGWKLPQSSALTVKGLGNSQFAAGLLLSYVQGVAFDPVGLGAIALPEKAGPRTQNFPMPAGLADEHAAVVDLDVTARTFARLSVRGAVANAHEVDVAGALPGSTAMQLDRTVATRPTLTWTNPAALATAADGTAAIIEYPRISATVDGPAWVIVAPATLNTLKLPDVPVAHRSFLTGAAVPTLAITHFASSKVQNYREFLKEPVKPTIEDTSNYLLARDLPAQSTTLATTFVAP
jgi:hypothetical protein